MRIIYATGVEIVNNLDDIEIFSDYSINNSKFSGGIRRRKTKNILFSTAFAFNSKEAAEKAMKGLIEQIKDWWKK